MSSKFLFSSFLLRNKILSINLLFASPYGPFQPAWRSQALPSFPQPHPTSSEGVGVSEATLPAPSKTHPKHIHAFYSYDQETFVCPLRRRWRRSWRPSFPTFPSCDILHPRETPRLRLLTRSEANKFKGPRASSHFESWWDFIASWHLSLGT